jgi:hypothetical protein
LSHFHSPSHSESTIGFDVWAESRAAGRAAFPGIEILTAYPYPDDGNYAFNSHWNARNHLFSFWRFQSTHTNSFKIPFINALPRLHFSHLPFGTTLMYYLLTAGLSSPFLTQLKTMPGLSIRNIHGSQ